MKRTLLLIAACVVAFATYAQSPNKMSYQAVVRDASDALVTNSVIGMQVSVLQGSATGSSVYTETQTPTSNVNGLVSIEIGSGTIVSGDFSTIDWANGSYFVMTEMDPSGGTIYTITGISQLLSVPYALYSENSGSSIAGPQGPQGPAGTDGVVGATGPQGMQGPTGAAGLDGATGQQGIQGTTGANGLAGPTGMNGSVGPTGIAGLNGAAGPTGANGSNGLNGVTGAQGNAGVIGVTGSQGVPGPTGANGLAGATGMNGTVGATGPMGLNGVTGMAGLNGATGPTGAMGMTGATGVTGLQGPTGVQGMIGTTGPTGIDGVGIAQTLSQSGNVVTLSDGGGSVTITDNDTQLSESQVDSYVSNNGFLSSEIDGSTTNEIQAFSVSLAGDTLYLENSNWVIIPGISLANLPPAEPTVLTTTITDVSYSSVNSGGNITDDGGAPVTARGIVWGTTSNPTIGSNIGITSNGSGSGIFVSSITGLSLSTTYYVRSYATNSIGTSYGQEETFTTTLSIGDTYEGGLVFYIDGSGEHGLVAAPSNQGSGPYGSCGTGGCGSTGSGIGTGSNNTILIESGCADVGTAADRCANLVLSGYNDWFLPSKNELNEMLSVLGASGSFSIGYYWSSTEQDTWSAWFEDSSGCGGACQAAGNRTQSLYVRAVRQF
jgi:hypothetical protein